MNCGGDGNESKSIFECHLIEVFQQEGSYAYRCTPLGEYNWYSYTKSGYTTPEEAYESAKAAAAKTYADNLDSKAQANQIDFADG